MSNSTLPLSSDYKCVFCPDLQSILDNGAPCNKCYICYPCLRTYAGEGKALNADIHRLFLDHISESAELHTIFERIYNTKEV